MQYANGSYAGISIGSIEIMGRNGVGGFLD